MKVLLTAINAKYIHSSLAIRYIYKNCQDLSCDIEMLEVSINNHLIDIANQIFDARPDILGISCYIWNIELVKQVLPLVHRLLPNCKIICGGPEVSYATKEFMQDFPMVDFVVRGEGEKAFHDLLQALLDEKNNGVVFNGIYSREMSNIYAKPVENANSKYTLSNEETEAIEKAVKSNNLYKDR